MHPPRLCQADDSNWKEAFDLIESLLQPPSQLVKLTKDELFLYCNQFNHANKLVKRRNQRVRELKNLNGFNFEKSRREDRSTGFKKDKLQAILKDSKRNRREEHKAHVKEGGPLLKF